MTTAIQNAPDIGAIKARLKATWESGDFGEVARHIETAAAEFMARVPLKASQSMLDAACGNGNLAIIAARHGCNVRGLDIAANLIGQARARARSENLDIEYIEGDAEAMPYADESFDVVTSMFGVMFAPRPELIVSELARVTKPGGLVAMANWTPGGFIGRMFKVFGKHLPPNGLPSPLLWGDETVVRERLGEHFDEIRLTPRIARFVYPFGPAEAVEFFRQYYGPTNRAFASLAPQAQAALRADLVQLQSSENLSKNPNETINDAEYLEIHARRIV